MTVSSWWLVNDAQQLITAGPFLWDGAATWTPPSGQRAVNSDPTQLGYTWAGGMPADLISIRDRVAALENRLMREARGVSTVPLITSVTGGTVTARVALKSPVKVAGVASTNFTPQAVLVPNNITGTLKVTGTTVIDASTVDVAITSTGPVVAGAASVLVFADAN